MTDEEKKAYFAKREQRAKEQCQIKTKEQFIEECRKADIPDHWYAFYEDRSKPVSMNDNTVFYGKNAKTDVSYPFQRYDIAYDMLKRYKITHAWEHSGERYRIDEISWIADTNDFFIRDDGHFGTEYISDYDRDWTNEKDMVAKGWIFDHYDQYMGKTVYRRSSGYRSEPNVEIVVEFTKITDERDKREFGFSAHAMRGSYRYPVPAELKSRVIASIRECGGLTETLKEILIHRFDKTLLEDEFNALIQLRDAHRRSQRTNADSNPAADNILESRSYVVTHTKY